MLREYFIETNKRPASTPLRAVKGEEFFFAQFSHLAPQMLNKVLSSKDITRAISRVAHEILERNREADSLVLVGIRTRGVFLAQRLKKKIEEIDKVQVEMGVLDITLYRDDILSGKNNPVLKKTEIPFALDGKKVILCDDVLYTGRTIRAAIDALMDFGRPSCVQLAVMIDRGHRELPIRPDFVGKNLPTSKDMLVKVKFKEVDEEDLVVIHTANSN